MMRRCAYFGKPAGGAGPVEKVIIITITRRRGIWNEKVGRGVWRIFQFACSTLINSESDSTMINAQYSRYREVGIANRVL